MHGLQFFWDRAKDASNRKKHGVSFDEAKSVFTDDFARLIPDPDHSIFEERFILMGMSNRLKVLVVCHSETPPNRIRIISARTADRSERQQYEAYRYAQDL